MIAFKHPEAKIGEIFLTNSNTKAFNLIPFSSKRKGVYAYNGDGRKIQALDWFPVFISVFDFLDSEKDIKDLRKETRDLIQKTMIKLS